FSATHEFYRPNMTADEYIRSEPGIFNPWRQDYRNKNFPLVELETLNLDAAGWSVWKSSAEGCVYRSTMPVGGDPTLFYFVSSMNNTAVEIYGYGIEIGVNGEIFVADEDYALFRVDRFGRGEMLLREGSAVGNIAINVKSQKLAFEAGVIAAELVIRGVAVLDLKDYSWELLAHGFSMEGVSHNIHVLWWQDEEIIINELNQTYGLFLERLDLKGSRMKHTSFNDPSIPIFGLRLPSPDRTEIALLSYNTQEIIRFDLKETKVYRENRVRTARWKINGELYVLPEGHQLEKLSRKH
ncbi:MAG: hypothetical protein Q8S19_00950, partial [Bacillota bacterium]|nr:hypothetical protein [Bacillota bacterium]